MTTGEDSTKRREGSMEGAEMEKVYSMARQDVEGALDGLDLQGFK